MTGPRAVPNPRPVVTVCGLPADPPPSLLRALAALGDAAYEAFGEPVTVQYETPTPEENPCPSADTRPS